MANAPPSGSVYALHGTDNSTNLQAQSESSAAVIVKEGWLRKKGSRANLWSERYFVLRGPSLFYFIKSDNVVCDLLSL